MAEVSDFVSDATPRECKELAAALRVGEGVRWAVRPLPKRRALYVLTNHRALIIERGWFSCKLQAYPLHEHMVYMRLCRPGGGGDLLFAAGADAGFTYLPNLLGAQRELNAAVNALLDAAERRPGVN